MGIQALFLKFFIAVGAPGLGRIGHDRQFSWSITKSGLAQGLQSAQRMDLRRFSGQIPGWVTVGVYPVGFVFVFTIGPINWQSSTAETPSKCADGESEVKTPGISLGCNALEVRPLFFSAGSM